MIPTPFRVLLDANVLFPFTLRDTLLRAAAAGFFQLYWSEEILEETRRNLVEEKVTSEKQAARLVAVMKGAFPEAAVTGYEALIEAMKNDEKDRHVAAAALKGGAQVIVTNNLKDFRDLPEGIEAQSPDHFLANLFDLSPDAMVELLKEQSAALTRPPRSFEDVVSGLERPVPSFARAVREHAAKSAGP